MANEILTREIRVNPGLYKPSTINNVNVQNLKDQFDKYRRAVVDLARNPKQINQAKIDAIARAHGSTFSRRVFNFFNKSANYTDKALGVVNYVGGLAGKALEAVGVPKVVASMFTEGPGMLTELGVNAIQKLAVSGRGLRDLIDFDFRGQTKVVDFAGKDFAKLGLTNLVEFDAAILDGSNFQGAILGAGVDFCGTSLKKANFREADLRGIQIKTIEYKGQSANTDFSGADMSRAILEKLNCSCADFVQTNLSQVDARRAIFNGSCLDGAKVERADLTNADFSNASLKDVDLSQAEITGAIINDKTNLANVKLKVAQAQALGLTRAQIEKHSIVLVDAPTQQLGSQLPPYDQLPPVTEGSMKPAPSSQSSFFDTVKDILKKPITWIIGGGLVALKFIKSFFGGKKA